MPCKVAGLMRPASIGLPDLHMNLVQRFCKTHLGYPEEKILRLLRLTA